MSLRRRTLAHARWAAVWLALLGLPVCPSLSATIPSSRDSPIANTEPSGLRWQIITVLNLGHDATDRRLAAIAGSPAEAQRLQADAMRAWRNGDVLRATIHFIVLLMIGGGAEWLYWCYAGKEWRRIAEAGAGGRPLPSARAATLGLRRAALAAAGAIISMGGVLAPSSMFASPSAIQAGLIAAVLAVTAARIMSIASALILSPRTPRLRLVARPEKSCRRLSVALIALAAALAGGAAAESLLVDVLQAPGLAALASAVDGVVGAGLALLVLRRWPASGRKRSSGATLYPIALTVLVLLCSCLHLLGAREMVSTVLLWAAAFMLGKLLSTIVDAYTAATEGTALRATEYRPVVKSGIRMILFGAATMTTPLIWGVPLLQLFESPNVAGRMFVRGVDLTVVLLAVDLIWVWARTIIDGKLAPVPRPATAGDSEPSARVATLLPLLRKCILVALLGLAGLTTLSTLGVNIVPLLAGAGVGGIAIGLGAQTLVRDIVSGVFYLLADSFRLGEYVEFGEIHGAVEAISLRFLRVRHHRGALYTVPFGEIRWLVNLSRDWAIMKLEFHVPLQTDLALVKRIVEQIGAELRADPELGRHILEPLEFRGVVRMEEFTMVLNVKCMTKANGGRFDIRREAYHRIRDALDAHGIRTAPRNAAAQALADQDAAKSGHDGISLHEMFEILHETAAPSAPHT